MKQAAALPKRLEFPARLKWLMPVLLVVFIGLGLALRAHDLGADPPDDLSWSLGIYSDEAHNTYSARNLALYGKLKVDDYVPFVVYPLVNALVALFFRLFGVGLVQLRLLSMLAGTAAILVMFLLVRREAGVIGGLVAALATALCYPLVMYSRLGLVETVQVLFLMATALFFSYGRGRSWLMLVSGFLGAGTVLFVKVSGLFVVPAALLAFLWFWVEARRTGESSRPIWGQLAFWLVGAGVAGAVWLFAVFLPHSRDYARYVFQHSFASPTGHPSGIVQYLLNTFAVGGPYGIGQDPLDAFWSTFDIRSMYWLYPKVPFVALFGFAFLPAVAKRTRPGVRFLLLAFGAGYLMLGFMNYHPVRYELVFLPALLAAGAVALTWLVEAGRLLPDHRPTLTRLLLYGLWLWPALLQLAVYTRGFWGVLQVGSDALLLLASLVVSLVLVGVGHVAVGLVRGPVKLRSKAWRLVVAAALLLLALRVDLAQYRGWYQSRTHNMILCSRDAVTRLPEDAVVAGFWAPALMVETGRRALFISEQWSANVDDPVGRYGITHLVVQGEGEAGLFNRLYPGIIQSSMLVQNCLFPDPPVLMYELRTREEPRPDSTSQGTGP